MPTKREIGQFMGGECAHFALALNEVFGYNFAVLIAKDYITEVDEETEEEYETWDFNILHILGYDSIRDEYIDIEGIRTSSDIKNTYISDYDVHIEYYSSRNDILKDMGDSDDKLLYKFSNKIYNEALNIILQNYNKYDTSNINTIRNILRKKFPNIYFE